MIVTVIGIGLIGGSFAHSMRDTALATKVIGVESNPEHAKKALELALVDEIMELEDAVAQSDLVMIATPVDHIPLLAIRILNMVNDKQIVIDAGSIKEELAEVIKMHPKRGRFVATHPMWGTEYSGPEAAAKGAFKGRVVVICDKEQSDDDAVKKVEQIHRQMDMNVVYMGSEEHDIHAAYISHISHITSFALALTVLEKELEEERIFDLAAGGFTSTVRLAKSSPETWVPIFLHNKYNVLDVLREHIHQLQILRKMLERDDEQGLLNAMRRANIIKKIIPDE